ncbi:unnamed protein product [Symbiodinium microadriaticum]|nr:unnamed protein product [Symbiodinium microadriaticum]
MARPAGSAGSKISQKEIETMALQVDIRSNIKEATRQLSAIQKKELPFATELALNETARVIKRAEERHIARTFDRPTSFTQKAIFIQAARKKRLTAVVGVKDRQQNYLIRQQTGGTRTPENKRILVGQDVPGNKANKFGNMPRNRVQRLLARNDTFYGTIKGTEGIWKRDQKGNVRLLVRAITRASYNPRFKFTGVAEKAARKGFPVAFNRALNRALATARRTVAKRLADGGIDPVHHDGKSDYYLMKDAAPALIFGGARFRGPGDGDDDADGPLNYEIEKARLTKYQADHEKLKVAEKEGHLIPVDMVADQVADLFARVRAKLLALPTRMAPELVKYKKPAPMKAALQTSITEALEDLVSDLTKSPDPVSHETGEQAEFQRGIMDAATDPAIDTITVMSCSQIGKTEFILNDLGYFIDNDPSPILVLQPTKEMAETFSKDRLAPMVRDTPCLTGKIADPKSRSSGNTILHKSFHGGHLTMVGTNSPAGLAMRPIRIVLCDEVDRYPVSAGTEGDPVELAFKRTATFWNRLKILISTPTVKGLSRIEASYDLSDKRRFFIPCPHCDHRFHIEWMHVDFQNKDPDSACLICPDCGGVMDDQDRWQAVALGEWLATNPDGQPGHAGFHLNELYSPWRSLSEIVSDFLAAAGNAEKMQVWTNTCLGESWEIGEEQVSANDIADRREVYAAPPMEALFLTCAVDVQDDRLEAEIKAWTAHEVQFGDRDPDWVPESWGIDYQIFHGDPGRPGVWKELDDWLLTPILREDGRPMLPVCTAIDSGGHHTEQVYKFCRGKAKRGVRAIKGVGGWGKGILGTPAANAKNKHRVRVWPVNVDGIKQTLLKSWLPVTEPGPGYMHFPAHFDDDYFDQLTAERLVKEKYRGKTKLRWVLPGGRRNEALDINVYLIATLAMLNPNWKRLKKSMAPLPVEDRKPVDDADFATPGPINRQKPKSDLTMPDPLIPFDHLRAGDSASWSVNLPDHPSPAWTLKLELRGQQVITLTAIPDPSKPGAHKFDVTSAISAGWTAGAYSWFALADDGATARCTIGSGSIDILPDPATLPGDYDGRSQDEIALEAIDAVLADKATKGQQAYSIAGRSLTEWPLGELRDYRNDLARRIRNAKGGNRVKKIRPVFGRTSHRRSLINATSAGAGIGGTMNTNQALIADLTRMRGQARAMSRNNPHVRRYLNMVARNVVGPHGITFRSEAKNQNGKPAARERDVVNRDFLAWCDGADVRGLMDFQGILRTAVKTQARDGECFLRFIRGDAAGNALGLALQFVDADEVDASYNGQNGNNIIVMGIEYDPRLRPVNYYLRKVASPTYGLSKDREKVPADDMIHLFELEDGNQLRGFPGITIVANTLDHLAGFIESETMAARVASGKMGFLKQATPEGEYGGEEDPEEKADFIDEVIPGAIEILPEGMDWVSYDPKHPNTNVKEFVSAILYDAAAGLDVSYANLTTDLSGANFSSTRAGTLDEREKWMEWQSLVIKRVCRRVYDEWLKFWLLQPAAPFRPTRKPVLAMHRWQGRRWPWVSPKDDMLANVMAIDNGLKSPRQVIEEQGGDADSIWDQALDDKETVDKLKTAGKGPDMTSDENPDPDDQEEDEANAEPDPEQDAEQAALRIVDEGKRIVELAFSSEYPVERYFGTEVLEHSERAIIFDRLRSGAPLLFNHWMDSHLGIVEKAWLDSDGIARARVRFTSTDEANERFKSVLDGTLVNVSVRYDVYEWREESLSGGGTRWTATRWEPVEISMVTIPADPTVGVGRGAPNNQPANHRSDKEGTTMNEEILKRLAELSGKTVEELTALGDGALRAMARGFGITLDDDNPEDTPENGSRTPSGVPAINGSRSADPAPANPTPAAPAVQTGESAERSRSQERARVNDILALGDDFGNAEAARAAVQEGTSFEDFRDATYAEVNRRAASSQARMPAAIDLSRAELTDYSLVRALRALKTNDWSDAGLEREASRAIANAVGDDPTGFYLPVEVLARNIMQGQRVMEKQTNTAGGFMVGTDHMAGMFIELLRPRTVLGRLGAMILPGLEGDVDIPRQDSGATAQWLGEGDAVTETDQTLGQVLLNPKTVAAATEVTRRMLKQATPAIDLMISNDLMLQLALAVDLAGLAGTGAANQPTGITNLVGTGSVTLLPGVFTHANAVDLETAVDLANALEENLAYVGNPNLRGTAKQTSRAGSEAIFVMDDDNQINGYRTEITTQMADDVVIFGNFANLIVAQWGTIDLTPDPYGVPGSKGGMIVRAFQDLDIGCRHNEGFAVGAVCTTVAVTEKDAKYLIARGLAAPADAVPQTDTDTDAEAGADVTAEGQEFRGLLEITAVEVYDDPAARDQIITLQYETEKAPSMAQGDDITVDGTIYQIRDVPADEFGTTTATLVRLTAYFAGLVPPNPIPILSGVKLPTQPGQCPRITIHISDEVRLTGDETIRMGRNKQITREARVVITATVAEQDQPYDALDALAVDIETALADTSAFTPAQSPYYESTQIETDPDGASQLSRISLVWTVTYHSGTATGPTMEIGFVTGYSTTDTTESQSRTYIGNCTPQKTKGPRDHTLSIQCDLQFDDTGQIEIAESGVDCKIRIFPEGETTGKTQLDYEGWIGSVNRDYQPGSPATQAIEVNVNDYTPGQSIIDAAKANYQAQRDPDNFPTIHVPEWNDTVFAVAPPTLKLKDQYQPWLAENKVEGFARVLIARLRLADNPTQPVFRHNHLKTIRTEFDPDVVEKVATTILEMDDERVVRDDDGHPVNPVTAAKDEVIDYPESELALYAAHFELEAADVKRAHEQAVFNKVKARLGGISRAAANVTKKFAGIAVAVGALAGIGGFGTLITTSAQAQDALAKTSDAIGIQIERLAGLQLAAELTGLGNQGLEKSIRAVVVRAGEAAQGLTTAKDAFAALGIEVDALQNASPDEIFLQVAEGMDRLESQTQKTTIASQLFGKRNLEVINTLKLGREGIAATIEEAKALGLALNRVEAAKIEEANDAMTRLRAVSKGFGNQLTVTLAPVITSIANMATEWVKTSGIIEKGAVGLLDEIEGLVQAFVVVKNVIDLAGAGFDLLVAGYKEGVQQIAHFSDRFFGTTIGDLGALAKASINSSIAWEDYKEKLSGVFTDLSGQTGFDQLRANLAKAQEESDKLAASLTEVAAEKEKLGTPITLATDFDLALPELDLPVHLNIVEEDLIIPDGFQEGAQRLAEHFDQSVEALDRIQASLGDTALNALPQIEQSILRANAALEDQKTKLLEIAETQPFLASQAHALIEQAEINHQARLNDIRANALSEFTALRVEEIGNLINFEKQTLETQAQTVLQTGAALAGAFAGQSKKAFAIQKAFGIADALINTYKGINLALASAPPPFNFALAGLVAAQGFANVAAIRAAQPGGGGGRASAGGISSGGAGFARPAVQLPPTGADLDRQEGRSKKEITINLTGDNFSRQSIRKLIEQINEESEDGSGGGGNPGGGTGPGSGFLSGNCFTYIGHDDLFSQGRVEGSLVASDGDGALALNALPFDAWTPAGTSDATLTVDFDLVRPADYCAVFNCDLKGGELHLEGSQDGSAWTDVMTLYDADISGALPVWRHFAEQSFLHWRWRVTGHQAGVVLSVLFAGQSLAIPMQEIGWTPPRVSRDIQAVVQRSESGGFLGRINRYQGSRFDLLAGAVPIDWAYGPWLRFLGHAEHLPFFYYWDVGSAGDAVFCETTGDPAPHQFTGKQTIDATLPVRGVPTGGAVLDLPYHLQGAGLPLPEPGVIPLIPALQSVSLAPTVIAPDRGLGQRAAASIVISDFPDDDRHDADFYRETRGYDARSQGTFWSKWLARHRLAWFGRPLRVKTGFLTPDGRGGTVIDPAKFETRHYVIEKISEPGSDGQVTITAKDPLKKLNDAVWPPASKARLLSDISETATSCTLYSAGSDGLVAGSIIRMGSELIRIGTITPSGNNHLLAGLTRGAFGSQAQSHSQDETAQKSVRWSNAKVTDALTTLFTGAGINGFIDTAGWAAEESAWLNGTRVGNILSKPEKITDLVKTLCEETNVYIWWDDVDQKVRLRAIAPQFGNVLPPQITDDDILEGSIRLTDDLSKQVTRVLVWFDRRNFAEALSENNARKGRIEIDGDAESPGLTDRVKNLVIKAQWLQTEGAAVTLASRKLGRFRDGVREIRWAMDDAWLRAKGPLEPGDELLILSHAVVNETGSKVPFRVQVLERSSDGDRVELRAVASEFADTGAGTRIGFWAPDNAPADYDQATPAQRQQFAFWARSDGTVTLEKVVDNIEALGEAASGAPVIHLAALQMVTKTQSYGVHQDVILPEFSLCPAINGTAGQVGPRIIGSLTTGDSPRFRSDVALSVTWPCWSEDLKTDLGRKFQSNIEDAAAGNGAKLFYADSVKVVRSSFAGFLLDGTNAYLQFPAGLSFFPSLATPDVRNIHMRPSLNAGNQTLTPGMEVNVQGNANYQVSVLTIVV